jgi:hypothetical protein
MAANRITRVGFCQTTGPSSADTRHRRARRRRQPGIIDVAFADDERSVVVDDVARAYAVLGLEPGASPTELRRRYRALARRWHPDRHADDAGSRAAATEAMARINEAYACLAPVLLARARARRAKCAPGRRPSREEIERMVATAGAAGELFSAASLFGWVGAGVGRVLRVVAAVALAARVVFLSWRRGLAAAVRDPELWMTLAAAAVFVAYELRRETAGSGMHRPRVVVPSREATK